MKTFLRLLPAAVFLLLMPAASSFQSSRATLQQRSFTIRDQQDKYPPTAFPIATLFAANEDGSDQESDSSSTTSNEVTDLDKATFDIAKEYAKTGIPEDSTSGGPKIGGFSIFLGCYVIFVIVDTIFHITPDENYIDALKNAVRNIISNNHAS